MSPNFSFNNAPYVSFAGIEHSRKNFVSDFKWLVGFSNFYDFFLSKFCPVMFFSRRHSPLISGIIKIVRLSSKKQMFRICTRAIVAFMQNIQAFRDFSKMQYPRNSAGFMIGSKNFHLPISISSLPCPFPTAMMFYDILKKSFSLISWPTLNPAQATMCFFSFCRGLAFYAFSFIDNSSSTFCEMVKHVVIVQNFIGCPESE